jgi:two-component system, OmpR family, sensor histidine kinase TctE
MRRARSLRWRLTLALLIVFGLGLVISAVLSTRETRQEAALSPQETLQEEAMELRKDARGGLVGIFLDEANDWLFVFVPLATASFALIWLIEEWSLRPLGRASREAAAIGPANPTGRVSTDELPLEIRPLIDAINDALERLDHAYAAQRRFTADAAHELRTPLTVLNLRLQRAKLDGTIDWSAVERDVAHMNRTTCQLMELARKEDPAWLNDPEGVRPINLSRVVREAAAAMLPFAEENGRLLEVDAPDMVSTLGRPDDLRDAIRNLLENALVHGAGSIRVGVRQESDAADQRVVIQVSDEGQGIADEQREEVFERFRKATPTSPGAGLGLAIVRQVVRAHGGEVGVRSGPGCRVEISLPVRK